MHDKAISYMKEALIEAQKAQERDEVPVGAVIVFEDKIIARAGNEVEERNNPTAHAEMLAIERACQYLQQKRLTQCDMYVTLEPCTQCAGAISLARIESLYIGALDPKGGGIYHGAKFYKQPTCHHRPECYSGLLDQESSNLLKGFFQTKRKRKL